MKTKLCVILVILLALMNHSSNGQELIPAQCSQTTYGFKDKNSGELVIPCMYYKAWDFSEQIEGLAKVVKNATKSGEERATLKYGFIDKNGKEIVPLIYDEIYPFSEYFKDWAMVRQNGKYGFINKLGNEVIAAKFSNSKFIFSEGLALAMVNNRYGFIDKSGKEIIPYRYEYAENFDNGLSRVKYGGEDGYIDIAGNLFYGKNRDRAERKMDEKRANGEYNAIYAQIKENERKMLEAAEKEKTEIAKREKTARELEAKKHTFTYFAQNYVEQKIREWQQKGEFEKIADYQTRVNETTRKKKVEELTAEAEQNFINDKRKNYKQDFVLDIYDPENETYLFKSQSHGNFVVKVPIADAQSFKSMYKVNFDKTKSAIINDGVGISQLVVSSGSKDFKSDNIAYTQTKIDYNFEPIDISGSLASGNSGGNNQKISQETITVGSQKSDIDQNIPKSSNNNNNTFVLIIANQDYQKEQPILTAKNDANSAKNYCIQTLGIPPANVKLKENCTWKNMESEIESFAYTMQVNPIAKFMVFYFGHGMADSDPNVQDSYFLPIDGSSTQIAKDGYSRNKMLAEFSKNNPKQCIVFLESCFSGATPTNEMLAYSVGTSGVRVKEKTEAIKGNIVVFSASSDAQTAYAYMEQGHNLFTYELLKVIKSASGDISLGELFNKVSANTAQTANNKLNAKQNPTFLVGSEVGENWKGWKLK